MNDQSPPATAGSRRRQKTPAEDPPAALERLESYMAALHETAVAVLSEFDLAALLNGILRRAAALVDTEEGYIFLHEPDTDRLVIRYGIGRFTGEIGFSLAPGQGLAGRVWQTGAPIRVDCYDTWEGRHPYPGWDGMGFDLGLPLKSGERPIGVMGLCSFDRHKTVDRLQMLALTRLAELAAIALHNADLHARLKRELALKTEAEKRLRESEAQYRALVESAPVGIGVADGQGRLLLINQAMLQPGGYCVEDVEKLGGNVAAFYHDPAEREAALARFRAEGALRAYPVRFRRKDGSAYDALLSLAPVTFQGRACLQAIVEDVSERRRAEAEREQLQAQLLQAQKMESVGRLAGGVAHDFNNMLGVILGRVELLRMASGIGEAHREDLEEIHRAARRSADLTRQLLAFARRQTIAPRVLDLNDTVEGMLKMLRRLIGEDIELVWRPAAGLWPVKLDPAQVDQVLANLCVNARDAIDGTGRVTIETRNAELDEAYCAAHPGCRPGRYAMLAVTDDGCGMDAETLANLFEPFFTTKEPGCGTGLGLATVYGIVQQNEGVINVYSEPGQGTVFRIYLPATEEAPPAGEQQKTGEVPGGNETVLLVEDEPSVLDLGRRILERFGYTVLAARAPSEALALAAGHDGPIALAVTDVVMPEMDGKQLVERLQGLRPGIRALYTSGYPADVIARRGVLEDRLHFLQKPFTVEGLARKVREVLDA